MEKPNLNGTTILITGGTGSWGQELTRQILTKYKPKEIRIYSRNEEKQVIMRRDFNDNRLKFIIGDVRDLQRLISASKNVDYVFHLSALKHITSCEENPWEAILTNIYGVENMINACVENNIKRMVYVSTDKAVDPLNLYGICKACGERLVIAANKLGSKTVFVCIRGGNVWGTSGSVVPLFTKQIKENNEITLTDERMTRFFFSLPQAIGLVFKAFNQAVGGEVFVIKMPGCFIKDLAEAMVEELGDKKTKIVKVGIRPGEKIDEVLVSRYEASRVIDYGNYFVILPMIHIENVTKNYKNKKLAKIGEFSSRNTHLMDKEEIKNFFRENPLKKDTIIEKLDKKQLTKIAKEEKWVV